MKGNKNIFIDRARAKDIYLKDMDPTQAIEEQSEINVHKLISY